MTKPFKISNHLAFFEIENTQGKIEYSFNGVNYFNLFDLHYFIDTVKDSDYTDEQLAITLFEYAIYDA